MPEPFSEEDFFDWMPEPPSPPRRRRGPPRRRLPWWPVVLALVGLALMVLALAGRALSRTGGERAADPVAEGTRAASLAPISTPVSTATPTPDPGLETATPPPAQTPDLAQMGAEEAEASLEPVEVVDSGGWFADAVLIGDSRVAGLRLYSGITPEAAFLDHTGLTVYEVKEEKQVIRRGEQKISVLEALSGTSYAKVYLALGVNELGYFDPQGFAETYGDVVEAIRERLPEAKVYIQSIIPVNTAKCKANKTPYYITNEEIALYNEALKDYFAQGDVYLLGVSEDLLDENGEVSGGLSADGVHFKRDGYVIWLNYLSAHQEG